MEEKPVISASRTKDPVRVSPGRLAEILRGEAPARFGLGREPHTIRLDQIGGLVIWTKNPANMVTHPLLHEVLERYVKADGGVILLNLTVTGLGGSALEPGIPPVNEIRTATEALIDQELVRPEGIIIRYDPLIRVLIPDGVFLGNISLEVFENVLEAFCPMGVERVKTSLVDHRYAHVPNRLGKLGFTLDLPAEEWLDPFYMEMKERCERFSARLDVCCHPEPFVTADTRGCIDGHLINRLLEQTGAEWRVTNTLHNDIGRQRPTCKCTYSRDIGYSQGFDTCLKTHGGCLYCYSQKNTKGAAIDEVSRLLKDMKRGMGEGPGCACALE